MKISNIRMDGYIDSLAPFLDRRDKIGYAAARNTRRLQEASMEYSKLREDLINKYGEPEIDKDGNETGRYMLEVRSENFKKFQNEIEEIAKIEHDVQIFKLPYDYVIEKLTGSEILEIDWMLEDSDSSEDC